METDICRVNSRYTHSAITDCIIGCFYRVYNGLGFGFLESVNEQALLIELKEAGLAVQAQAPVNVSYRGREVGDFKADIVVEGAVLLDLKAARQLEPAFEAQVLNYLRATDLEVGLLLNFGPTPEVRRFIYDNQRKQLSVTSV